MKPLLLLLALSAVTGAATPRVARADDPSQKLALWEGRWTFSGQIYKTPYSKAHADSGTSECKWMGNHGYMICDYFSNDPPHNDLAIVSYNSATKAYTLVQVHKDSPPAQNSLHQRGNTWIATTTVPDNGKLLVMRTNFTFLSAVKQTTAVEISADNGKTWTKMIDVTAIKDR